MFCQQPVHTLPHSRIQQLFTATHNEARAVGRDFAILPEGVRQQGLGDYVEGLAQWVAGRDASRWFLQSCLLGLKT